MQRLTAALVLILASLVALPVLAAEPVLKLYGGANGLWYDGQVAESPSDFEGSANLRASLSPHISAVSGLFYGVNRSYVRGAAGLRFTATDVESRDFSIGLGIQYHLSSEASIRPEEWAPDVSIGWAPWLTRQPKLVLVAQGGYGLDSKQVSALVGVRYQLWKGGAR